MASGGARTFWCDGTSLLTFAEVASAMRVSTMTVYRLGMRNDEKNGT